MGDDDRDLFHAGHYRGPISDAAAVIAAGPRRRTSGLRREEAALLCHMSTDYYSRLERERGPHPSEQMIASIAQGLHLSLDERDHLFRLAGHRPPPRGTTSDHISPGLLRVLDRLDDTPAEIVSELGETLRQNALGVALTGETTGYTGPARSIVVHLGRRSPSCSLSRATSSANCGSRTRSACARTTAGTSCTPNSI
ncbi:helix-turn-helix domain-containing protein [Micromonospora sp. C51]|uniref:helix-turn-helix domain-containing protein n=1 Tax=Micromonospora sp. C51 TaxID=2824879 RepID=UPI0027DAF2FE|nr:helix-turn-helix domain-containing protein [Micromonospora sp. C51]